MIAIHYPDASSDNFQQRGFDLEKFLKKLFDLFDLDPRAAFRISGEQIDGSFSFEGTDYLLEAKWQNKPIGANDLDSLASKLSRKLDNTLGLFVSINGFSDDAVDAHSSGGRLVVLMDGSDLMAALEGRNLVSYIYESVALPLKLEIFTRKSMKFWKSTYNTQISHAII